MTSDNQALVIVTLDEDNDHLSDEEQILDKMVGQLGLTAQTLHQAVGRTLTLTRQIDDGFSVRTEENFLQVIAVRKVYYQETEAGCYPFIVHLVVQPAEVEEALVITHLSILPDGRCQLVLKSRDRFMTQFTDITEPIHLR